MARPIAVSIPVTDASGERADINIYYPAGTSTADVQSEVSAFVTLVDSLSACVIGTPTITTTLTLPGGLKTTALESDLVEDKAAFGFTDADGRLKEFTIPGYLETGYDSGTRNVDVGLAANEDLIGAVISGTGTTTIGQVSFSNVDLTAYRFGKKRNSSSR